MGFFLFSGAHFVEQLSWAILILASTGVAAWVIRGRDDLPAVFGAGGCLTAAAIGLWSVGNCLYLRQFEGRRELWNAPFASLSLGLDSLSALYLIPRFLVGAMAARAALRRLPGDYAANRPREHWLFLNITLAAAALALVSRNAIVFLFAWETMTVASFLLVENDQRERGARSGGWVYLTAGHLGGACLFAMFALLGAPGGSFDFATFKAAGVSLPAVFLLAYVGFGGKTGLAPFHAWYPESYPQSPAHVGAILSGVIGNLGVYGLLRVLYILGGESRPPAWWGYLLLFSGLASGVLGAARSLASRDLSRLLAWSSVENYGLMAAGIGLGLLGASTGDGVVSFLGFAAAIFHMLNHSISKALLFLAAGSVYARTGTRVMDRMGGLMVRLPLTGTLFLAGALGAAAIPPLNGFASEFLLLMSAYTGAAGYHPASLTSAANVVALTLLAVVGGLAAAAYIKAFGFIFLGNPRGPGAASGAPERRLHLVPHLILAATAFFIAAVSPRALDVIRPTAEAMVKLWRHSPTGNMDIDLWLSAGAGNPLDSAFLGSWLLAGCVAAAFLVRCLLTWNKARAAAPTWDCGYAAPDVRMQYTATSFSRPLAENFQACVSVTDNEVPPSGIFPDSASFSSATPGVNSAWGYSQLFAAVSGLAARVRVLQAGRIQLYLLYMAVVLVILLLWKL